MLMQRKYLYGSLVIVRLIACYFYFYFMSHRNLYSWAFFIIINPCCALLCFHFYKKMFVDKKHFAFFILVFDISFPIFGWVYILFLKIIIIIQSKQFKTQKTLQYRAKESQSKDTYNINNDLESKEDIAYELMLKRQETNSNHKQKSIKNIIFDALQIEPYIDILLDPTIDSNKKLSIINKVQKNPSPENVRLLQYCLNDNNHEVKYFARNTLEQIEKIVMNEISRLSEHIQAEASYDLYNKRANQYLSVIYHNFLSKELEQEFYEKALYDYIFSLQFNPNQNDVKQHMIQICVETERFDQALEIINDMDLKDENNVVQILFYKAEVLFHKKNFSELKKICQKILDKYPQEHQLIKDITTFWTSNEAI